MSNVDINAFKEMLDEQGKKVVEVAEALGWELKPWAFYFESLGTIYFTRSDIINRDCPLCIKTDEAIESVKSRIYSYTNKELVELYRREDAAKEYLPLLTELLKALEENIKE